MSVFELTFVVVGAFLVMYATLLLARSGKHPREARSQSLGCGFTLVAGCIWGIALALYLDSWWAGLRLGLGLAFVLPALAALLSPHKRNVIGTVVMLSLAVVLSAPVLPRVLHRLQPSEGTRVVQQLNELQRTLDEHIADTVTYIQRLDDDREGLRSQVTESGYASFEELAADDDAYALLKELYEVRQLEREAEKRLAVFREKQDRVSSAVRRAQRLLEAREALGETANLPDIAALRREVEQSTMQRGPTTVEEHVEREQLRELFEETSE
ncbi:MAG: hypothetical protein K9N51_00085 [Candidatus Pacebacteria bacterium]|nr:hypothetical protein [Candidatus Paceibacterota bacterium]